MSFKKAPSRQARFQFLQGEVSSRLLRSGTQEGFTVAARGIENIARIVEHDAVLFACWYFVGNEAFGHRWSPVNSRRVRAGDTPPFQLNHPRTALASPGQVLIGQQHSRTIACSLGNQACKKRLGVQVGAQDWPVEQYNWRLAQQHTREGHAAPC